MKFDEDCEVIWHDRKRFLGMPLSFTRYYLVKKGNEWIKIFRHKGLLSSLIEIERKKRRVGITEFQAPQ